MFLNKKFKQLNYLLFSVLFVGLLLRFYNFFDIPFTHDEFSTLFRTNFNSFQELINKGVKIDAHPAGLQVWVYYYKKLFGYEEWVIKFPFLVFGIVSIYFFYKVFSKWYNQTLALICISFYATIQYFVMYSQIARPYSSGLFFVSLLVYFFDKIIFEKKDSVANLLSYSIVGALCLYNHHFSALMALVITITGLFFSENDKRLKFLLSGILIFILYLPHLSVFFAQLKIGGLSEWLNKPDFYFIFNYFKYVFGFSWLNFLLVIFLIAFTLKFFSSHLYFSRYTVVCLVWFLIPFLIGYLYSVYRAPVLQYSVLIFSFPFFIPLLFGGIKNLRMRFNFLLVSLIIIVNVFVLIKERKHYDIFYKSCYKSFLLDYPTKVNPKKLIAVFDTEYSHKKIVNHYIDKFNFKERFTWAEGYSKIEDWIKFIQEKSEEKSYFYYATTFDADPKLLIVLLDYFPTIVFQRNYMTGTIFLLKKGKHTYSCEKNILMKKNGLAKLKEEYSGEKVFKIQELIYAPTNLIDISVEVDTFNFNSTKIVSSIEYQDSIYDWRGEEFNTFKSNVFGANSRIHLPVKLSDIKLNNSCLKIKTFLWKPIDNEFKYYNFKLSVIKSNPRIYGLFNPIEE